MDANGTRFQLRLGERDWAEPLAAPGSRDVVFERESGSLALDEVAQIFPEQQGARDLGAADRRGADCDRFGNWYWIDADRRRIRTVRSGRNDPSDYWQADLLDAEPCPDEDAAPLFTRETPPAARHAALRLAGLAVTTGHYLVVGTQAPAGLLVFDLHAFGPPSFQPWPEAVGLRPFDMERTADGGLWLLEDAAAPGGARFWRLDGRLRPVPTGRTVELAPAGTELFKPPGGTPAPIPATLFPDGFPADLGSPAPVLTPRAIVGLPDGTVLILDTGPFGPSAVVRLDGDRPLGEIVLDAALLERYLPPPAEPRGHDMAFVPDPDANPGPDVTGDLVIVGEDGNQAFRLRLRADQEGFELTLLPDYLPLRRFGGRALVAHEGQVHYDLDERWLALMAHPRRRYRPDGVLAGLVLDGRTPGCVWHRLVLDGCIPAGAAVTIEARAADDSCALEDRPWDALPPPYRRGDGPEAPARLPFGPDGTPTAGTGAAGTGAFETLFQAAVGRYLELRLTLVGGGRLTPRIHALRVHHPRFSYLERYLPATYREDPVSASFLDRFLANPEGFLTVLEDGIAAAEGLLDTRIAPAGFLPWLAGWLGATLDADWADWRRRLFIDHAELLFRWRGTLPGLRALLSVAIDDCPDRTLLDELRGGRPTLEERPGRALRIVEAFLLRRFGGVELGDPQAGGAAPALSLTVAGDAPWTPEQGAGPLHQRFRDFVLARHADLAALAAAWDRTIADPAAITLSPIEPASAGEAADWRAFIAGPIGFTYWPATAQDAQAWRAFLERRYGHVGSLDAAWQRLHASFDAVELPGPDDFPAAGARLADWIAFVSIALPIAATAHRFTVLVPTAPGESGAERAARVDRVRALVEREKPAHTLFEVRPFWALFQVGTARLGLDTVLGEGARFTAIELGRSALADGHLAFGHPWSVPDRAVIGRDQAGEYRI